MKGNIRTSKKRAVKGEIRKLFLDTLRVMGRLVRENARLQHEIDGIRILQDAKGRPPEQGRALLTPLEQAERETIIAYLIKTGYNQRVASNLLGIRPNTLGEKIRKYRIPGIVRNFRGGR